MEELKTAAEGNLNGLSAIEVISDMQINNLLGFYGVGGFKLREGG